MTTSDYALGYTPRRGDAALFRAMLAGESVPAAARRAGMGRSTAYRRINEPAWRRELERQQAELVGAFQRRLIDLSGRALNAVARVLDDPDAPAVAVLMAARLVLDRTLPAEKVIDLTTRREPSHGGTVDVTARRLAELAQRLGVEADRPALPASNGHSGNGHASTNGNGARHG